MRVMDIKAPGDPMAERVLPAAGLAVTKLSLTGFRSYRTGDLVLDGRSVVLVGPNGAGKTNVLEALSLLAPGRGLRGAKSADLVHVPSAEGPENDPAPGDWAVAVTLRDGEEDLKLGTGTTGTGKRVARINGAPASGMADLASRVRLAWLTPAMDRLFVDAPAERRKFLDRLVLGDAPTHAGHAAAYERAMRTRNRLLGDGQNDPAWYGALETQMAEHGAAMVVARLAFLERLRGAVDIWESVFPQSDLVLEGSWEDALRKSLGDPVAHFAKALADGRGRDMAAGRSLHGPHRSDLLVSHRAKAMPARDCSTGEQKALLIGLVLANARLRAAEDGRPPLLLLDEVAAHLDGERRAALFDELCHLGMQAWMTGTDAVLFDSFEGRAQMIGVEHSRFRPLAS